MGNGGFSLGEVLERVSDEATGVSGVPDDGLLSLSRDVPLDLTGEADCLGLALACLIECAAACMDSGRLSVSVETAANASKLNGKVMLRFTVRDEEAGLTGAQTADLLRNFTGACEAGANGNGSAAGILTGEELVESLGGRIAVESLPRKGFAFSFTAVFGVQDGHDAERFKKTEIKMPDNLDSIRNARILLVEDHPVNQNLTREILVNAGCSVELAEDGQQAVDAVRDREPYDAILMDIQMPIMDGFKATRIIREELGVVDVPIIAMTANVYGDERDRCIEAGMNEHVPKPIHIPDLYASLIKWISLAEKTPADRAADGGDSKPAADTTGGDIALPGRIAGIDIEAGLARAMGNRALYAELLAQFAATNETLCAGTAAAIDRDDLDRARFLVHGLSSTAGNLGADKLHSIATDLEKALIGRSDDIGELFEVFRKTLSDVIEKIDKSGISLRRAAVRIGKGDAPFDTDKVRQLVDTITAMLRDQDLGALEEVGNLLELAGGRGQDEQLKKLEASLIALDFAGAAGILESIGEEVLD